MTKALQVSSKYGTRLFDRIAVALFSGFTSWILLSLLWLLMAYELEIVFPYYYVIVASSAMTLAGFMLRQNFIANMFSGLMKVIAGMTD